MKQTRRILAVIAMLLGAGYLPGAGSAQEVSGVDTIVETPADEGQEATRKDPFALDSIASAAPEASISFRPAEKRPARMPELHLRGIGRMSGGANPTAMLEVKGAGLFVVEVDDTISLQGVTGDNVLRIVDISDISVTVEAGSFGELIVVQ